MEGRLHARPRDDRAQGDTPPDSKLEAPQLIFTGRQAIDDDMGAVGAEVAELLGWPCLSWIMEEAIADDGTTVRVGRQVEGGLEVFELPLPCVLTAQKGLNEPRYPTLKGIMGAKKKEIKDLKAADLAIDGLSPALQVVALEALPPRPPGRILTGEPQDMARELVRNIQDARKAAGFEIADRIRVHLGGVAGDHELETVVRLWGDYIRAETLADDLILDAPAVTAHIETLELDGRAVQVGVARVG